MTDLLDVIDELTKPKVEHVAQRTDGGEWIRTHTVDLPPLLQRMVEAGQLGKKSGQGFYSY